jgi:MFS family permease
VRRYRNNPFGQQKRTHASNIIHERLLKTMSNISEESSLSYYGWIIVASAFLATMMGYGIPYSFGVFLKPLYSDFGWTRAMTAGAFSAYAISHTVFAAFAGWLTDKWGPRIVAATGGVCLAGSMIMMSSIATLRCGSFMCTMCFFLDGESLLLIHLW